MILNLLSFAAARGKLRTLAVGTVCVACGLVSSLSLAADTIKVGVLHSLSGTMAISETTLKDTMLMLVDEQNKKGGLLGCEIEAVVVDPVVAGAEEPQVGPRRDRGGRYLSAR